MSLHALNCGSNDTQDAHIAIIYFSEPICLHFTNSALLKKMKQCRQKRTDTKLLIEGYIKEKLTKYNYRCDSGAASHQEQRLDINLRFQILSEYSNKKMSWICCGLYGTYSEYRKPYFSCSNGRSANAHWINRDI